MIACLRNVGLHLLMLACVSSVAGCASYQWPRIDPSGQRVLVWPQQQQPVPLIGAPDPCAPPIVTLPGQIPQPTHSGTIVQPVPTYPAPTLPAYPGTQNPPSIPAQPPVTAPAIAVRATGPAAAVVGQTLTYQITVTNTGTIPAGDVVVQHYAAVGLSYQNSTPPSEVGTTPPRWRIGTLGPNETRTISVNMRADAAGNYSYCPSASSSSGQGSQHCVNTAVAAAAPVSSNVLLSVQGPERAQVGEEVRFTISVHNQGSSPSGKLEVQDTLDAGLQHSTGRSQIRNELGVLSPGQRKEISLTLRVTQPGSLRQVVELYEDGAVVATAPKFVTGSQPVAGPAVRMQIRSQRQAAIGEVVEFVTEIENTGTQPLTQLTLTKIIDPTFSPVQASATHQQPAAGQLRWQIAQLAPGEKQRRVITCQCTASAANACVRAELIGPGISLADQSCVTISQSASPPPAGSFQPGAQ